MVTKTGALQNAPGDGTMQKRETERRRRRSILTREEMPACPVATTVQRIGSKWKLLILRNLLARPWRFNERKKDLAGISQKVLSDSLRPILDAMQRWGEGYKASLR